MFPLKNLARKGLKYSGHPHVPQLSYSVFKISAGPRTLTGKIWVGPASFPSLSYINIYINFGKIVLRSGKFQILFWRLAIEYINLLFFAKMYHSVLMMDFKLTHWTLGYTCGWNFNFSSVYDISYLTNVRHSIHFYVKFYANQGLTLMLAHELKHFCQLMGNMFGKEF